MSGLFWPQTKYGGYHLEYEYFLITRFRFDNGRLRVAQVAWHCCESGTNPIMILHKKVLI